ncbi:metal ABC transporter solute-binding protein, Zn/Mn family [Umezawaea beigongshangensis]|uniref:metal ABC transporter solute-binding protein, Zn/Mn family n=1 Tax=Umezawaea beigongshangensis TaxID=2780383 RepID=UPI0018F213DF|nr:zinc ABC transporter substrate-binding protein [Umezawaea beigongshangensis]
MTLRNTRFGVAVAGLAVTALGLTACGSENTAADAGAAGKIKVVASTNVWGSVVAAVGGDAVEVTSIIADPSADPHSYESKPSDVVALNDARLVIFNGGGYDEFFEQLLTESGKDARRIEAFELSGKESHPEEPHAEESHAEETHAPGEAEESHAPGEAEAEGEHGHEHGEVNEHVWYDLETVHAVAEKAAEELSAVAPDRAADFTANAEEFGRGVDDLLTRLAKIGTDAPGVKAVVTEPVPVYLLEAAGVQDATPADYSEAIENETDVPASALAQTSDLITGKQVGVVVQNVQTENTVTDQLVQSAGTAGVPVVEVTETLPEGVSGYLDWMTKQVDALSSAIVK